MSRIFISQRIPRPGLDLLDASDHEIRLFMDDRPIQREELLAEISNCHAVLSQMADRVDREFLDAAGSSLQVISNYAVGHDNIDVPAATERGVIICNTPDVLTEATADIAWLLLMAVARRAYEGEQIIRSESPWEYRPDFLLGREIGCKTIAIIGAGRIGRAVARRAAAWKMRILYVSRTGQGEFENQTGAQLVELDDALREADFVSLHVPLTEQTHHLIDAKRLRQMKPTAFLINTSRGSVVDETALVQALREGTIAGAGLDVYEHEPKTAPGLIDCPNTFLLPHIGSATHETRDAMAVLAARNILAVLSGDQPPARVN